MSLIYLTIACPLHSFELFKHCGIYKNEYELADYLFNRATLNEKGVNATMADLNSLSITSNLDRLKVIQCLLGNINSKMFYYRRIKQQGPSYSSGTIFLGCSMMFALLSGLHFRDYLAHDQAKKEIRNNLHQLGAFLIVPNGDYASASIRGYVSEEKKGKVEWELNRLAGMDKDSRLNGTLFSGCAALLCAFMGANEILDNKYADYYETRLHNFKAMLEAKLKTN